MTLTKMFSICPFVFLVILQILGFPSSIYAQTGITLSSAVFGSDGLTVDIGFSGSTNKADKTFSFICSDLFTFTGSAEASCFWRSTSSLRMTLSASASNLVDVKSMVTVKASTIRPSSDLATFIPVSSITINKAVSPITPDVIISAPSTV
jgi:hypothetical protein